MTNTNEPLVSFPIYINTNKADEMQPDLTGSFEFKGHQLRAPIWTRRTRDGSRIYHSFSIAPPHVKGQKTEALVKGLKLYEIDAVGENKSQNIGPEKPSFHRLRRLRFSRAIR